MFLFTGLRISPSPRAPGETFYRIFNRFLLMMTLQTKLFFSIEEGCIKNEIDVCLVKKTFLLLRVGAKKEKGEFF